MRLKSAFEDFESSTLPAIAGLLGRFSYIGRLYVGEGVYEHWGLEKIHGEDQARRAIRSSHRVLLTAILRKPLASLLADLSLSCANSELTRTEFLTSLNVAPPTPISPAAGAHLRSALSALLALVESQRSASHQGASQPRQPAQEPLPPAGT
jgi:hypothetical protein